MSHANSVHQKKRLQNPEYLEFLRTVGKNGGRKTGMKLKVILPAWYLKERKEQQHEHFGS